MAHSYGVSDIGLAAAILLEKGRLVSVDRSRPRVEFLFEDTPALRDVVRRYWSNELICPAQSLLLSFKQAKHILHDYSA
ncbi:MAG: hypothetical protein ABIG34_04875 [Candidatus Peregrinibacteria bacterium]